MPARQRGARLQLLALSGASSAPSYRQADWSEPRDAPSRRNQRRLDHHHHNNKRPLPINCMSHTEGTMSLAVAKQFPFLLWTPRHTKNMGPIPRKRARNFELRLGRVKLELHSPVSVCTHTQAGIGASSALIYGQAESIRSVSRSVQLRLAENINFFASLSHYTQSGTWSWPSQVGLVVRHHRA